jgi:hypothetical protein
MGFGHAFPACWLYDRHRSGYHSGSESEEGINLIRRGTCVVPRDSAGGVLIAMPGPIVRSGPSHQYIENWDHIFKKKKPGTKKTAAATPRTKAAKKKKKK